jgi:SAM-dependent methyltransferase
LSSQAVGPDTLTTAESSWWEEERLKFLVPKLVTAAGGGPSLDVGCGRGTAATMLAATSGVFVVAVDGYQYPDWKLSDRVSFVVCLGDQLPFADGTFASASALDVIEHVDDDTATVTEMSRVVSSNGAVVLSVPAFQGLWSEHDVAVGHRRRYSKRAVGELVQKSELTPSESTCFFSYLAPPAWLLRHRRRHLGGEGVLTRRAARMLSRAERRWLRRKTMPFGTSLLVIASKRAES